MTHMEDIERLVTEIEMVQVVLSLVSRGRRVGDREDNGESGKSDCSDHIWMQ